MNDKYSLKIIQSGKTQQVKILREGAGIAGQAVVLKVADGARLQLVKAVTLVSPDKIELKRVGKDLHLALPGGDLSAPDLIVEDYFAVAGASLQGRTIDGEWMTYDTASLVQSQSLNTSATPEAAAWSDAPVVQREVIAALDGGSPLWKSPWAWVGGLAVAAGGGGGGTAVTGASPQAVISKYSSGGTTTAPTEKNYTDLGVILPTISGMTSAAVLDAMNALVASKTEADVSGAAALNTLALSLQTAYAKILAEANGTAVDATPNVNPTVADYASVGVVLSSKTKTLELLDSALGELLTSDVNTVAQLKVLATTAGDVMLLAAGDAATQTDTQLVVGLNALLKTTYVSMQNIGAIKATITTTADDGSAVDTVAELKTIAATQVLKDYANATNGSGISVTPTLAIYKDAGVKALKTLSETTASGDIDATGATSAATIFGSAWLIALNSALDYQVGDSTFSIAKLQAIADSYYRILSEADGVVNSTTNVDVYPGVADGAGSYAGTNDPSATDYTNIGVTVGNTKSIDLLNDYVGLSQKTAVDTIDELNVAAKAAYNVMYQAGMRDAVASGTAPAVYATDAEWVAGLTALGISGVNTNNIAAVKTAIAGHVDGTAVDSVQELKDLLKEPIALQVFKDYANATNGVGVTTIPTLTTYKDAGIKAFASLNETTPSADIDSPTLAGTLGVTSSTVWLSALNTALDKLDGTTLDKAKIQAMVNSYYRILAEADNATNNVDVYPNIADGAGSYAGTNDPSATDYTNIGATVGNAKSVDLLNDFVGLSADAAVDTVDEINAAAKAAYNVMYQAGMRDAVASGTAPAVYATDAEWVAGLTALGISGLNTNNIAAVKTVIAAGHADGTAVDTMQELKDLIKEPIALQVLKDYANATNGVGVTTIPTLATYKDIGIDAPTNLTATTRIAVDDPSVLMWLGTGNATAVTSAVWLSALNTALDKLDGTTLDKTTIQTMVNSYYRILAEADGVVNTTTNTQVSTSNNDPLASDYTNIGATVGNPKSVDLLNDFVGLSADAAVDTVDEINAAAKAAYNVMVLAQVKNASGALDTIAAAGSSVPAIYSTTDGNAEWIAGLNTLLGLNTATGVNSNNIVVVKNAIAGTASLGTANDGVEVDTVAKLHGYLSLVRLQNFTDDTAAIGSKFMATPTLDDWNALGLTANTSLSDATRFSLNQAVYWKTANPTNGLAALNSALDTFAGSALGTFNGSSLSQTVAQDLVNSYGRILQEADGSRATNTDVSKVGGLANSDAIEQDLINIGVKYAGTNGGVTSADTGIYYLRAGELLASSIGSLSSTAVDTVSELNALTDIAVNVMKQARGDAVSYTDDTQWVNALSSLGIIGANTSNMTAIKTAILNTADTGADVDSWDKLQALVSEVRLNDYAALNTGYTVPLITDYQAVVAIQNGASHYSDAKAAYLSYYNDAVNSQSTATAGSVADMVTNYTALLDSADGNRGTSAAPVSTATQAYTELNKIFGISLNGAAEASLLEDIVSGLTVSNISTVKQLSDLATTVNKIIQVAGGTSQTFTRTEFTNLGLTDGNNHTFSEWNSSTGDYWVKTSTFAKFIANTPTNAWSIGGAGGASHVDTWQELQNLATQAVLNG